MSKKKYPLRIPRAAAGIRAQESRTGGGRSWWAREWLAAIERMELGARLGRGKNYALSGQITAMQRAGPHVVATVVGSRADPYTVTIDFREPDAAARALDISFTVGDGVDEERAARCTADIHCEVQGGKLYLVNPAGGGFHMIIR